MENLITDEGFWISYWYGISSHGTGIEIRNKLIKKYSEAHRAYHTTQHLNECLHFFKIHQSVANNPEDVFLAIWYHDAIYKTTSHNNEQESAVLAAHDLKKCNVSPEKISTIVDLILVTQHSSEPTTPDQKLIIDIDLSILGATSQRFTEYERQIRKEYFFVPDDIFKSKRAAILQGFLDRPTIYNTPDFIKNLENQARLNLIRAIS